MYCKNCGKEMREGSTFCAYCGAAAAGPAAPAPPMQAPPAKAPRPPKAPKPPKPPRQKKSKAAIAAWAASAAAVVLAVLLVLSLVGLMGGGGGMAFSSKSFGTPEDAIEYFVDHVKAGDFEGALQACAVGELVENFDYEAWVDRIHLVMPVYISGMPSEYREYRVFNEAFFAEKTMRQVMSFYIGFSLPEKFQPILTGREYSSGDDDLAREAMKAMEPPDLSGLKIVKIAEHDMIDNDINERVEKDTAKTYGADDYTTRSVLYELDGDYYIGGFGLLEYNGRWLIVSLTDPLSGTSPMGNAELLDDKDDFNDRME